jgi:hypothetical protein
MPACGFVPGVGEGTIGVGVGTMVVGVGTMVGVLMGRAVGVGVLTGFPASAGEAMATRTTHRPRKTSRTGRDLRILNILLQINA